MKKKKSFGQGTIISIYRFMEYCGLNCPKKENVLVSHKIMMRKLELRKGQFPEKIQVPKHIPFSKIKKEEVFNGTLFLVKDDYNQVLPYFLVRKFHYTEHISDEELAKKREDTLKNIQINSEEMSEGYKKYLYRKNFKELEEAKLAILKMLKDTRYKRVNNRKYAY